MNHRNPRIGRELAALAYVDAFDAGDLDAMAALWEQAGGDPDLENLLCDVSEGLASEQEPGPGWHADAATVAELLKARLPSSSPRAPITGPLTAGDVAARIAGDDALLRRLTSEDRQANAQLVADRTPLPSPLGWTSLEQWSAALPVRAGVGYWRLFQQVAIPLAMSRWQRAGSSGATLAAARPAQPPGQSSRTQQGGREEPGREREGK